MRIACIHIPQFALQAANRQDPSLTGKAVALSVAAPGAPVVAYSRQAYALGVRAGMSAPVARHLSSELQVIAESHAAERELVAAIAESLLAIAPMVDRGGRTGPNGLHYALYCEVPAGTRGATFGARARELVAAHGVSVRIGIADDKFTAWAAASQIRSSGTRIDDVAAVVSVPRGGAAAFLAPLPLSMLPISPEVQHMLSALGVKTLGEFAALPEPTTGSAAGTGGGTFGGAASDDGFGMDLQALARGDSREAARLIPYRGRAVTSESITITPEHSAAAAIGMLAERLALVLKGRGEAAAQIRFKVRKADDSVRSVELILVPTVVDASVLADRLGACLGDAGGAVGLSVEVVGVSLHGPVAEPAPMAPPQEPAEIMDSLEHGFQLALPTSELGYNAPDGHRYRRMRRGKQRRRSEVTAQSRLFGG